MTDGKPIETEMPDPEAAAAAKKKRLLELMKAKPARVHNDPPPPRPGLIVKRGHEGDRVSTMLHLGVTALLAGEGGVGKTSLGAALAVAVASGAPWIELSAPLKDGKKLGHDSMLEPERGADGGVLYVAAEEEHIEIERRLYHACWTAARLESGQSHDDLINTKQTNEAFDRIKLAVNARVRVIALADTEVEGQALAAVVTETRQLPGNRSVREVKAEAGTLFEAVAAELKTPPADNVPWRLVILDPLVELLAIESENDNRQVATALRAGVHPLRRIVEGKPVTVLALHHTNKVGADKAATGADRIRGASAFVNSARFAALLTRGEGESPWMPLEVVKANYGKPVRRADLKYDDLHGNIRGVTAAERAEAESEAAAKEATVKAAKAAKKNGGKSATPPAAEPEIPWSLIETEDD